MRCAIGGLFLVFVTSGCGPALDRIDAESLGARLDWIPTWFPTCTTDGSAPPAPPNWRDASGTCGGALTNLSEHADGVTDFDITFADYCVETSAGPVTFNGHLLGKEIGTPTDSGPLISKLEVEGDGDLSLERTNGEMLVAYGKSRTTYGVPSTWYPDAPTDADPDRTSIDQIEFTFPDDGGRVDVLENLELHRTSGFPATLHIREGYWVTEGQGAVAVSTPDDDPLVLQLTEPFVTGGAIRLSGAGGTEATLVPNATPGSLTFDVLLEGEPFDRRIDCGSAHDALVDFLVVMAVELSIP